MSYAFALSLFATAALVVLGSVPSGASAATPGLATFASALATSPSSSLRSAEPAATPAPGQADPAPAPAPASTPLNFDVNGFGELRTGLRGRVTIAGTFRGTYDPSTGRYVGSFALTPTIAHVTVMGVLPVAAETDWIFTEPVTGELRDGVLSMRIAVRIRHPRLFAFGGLLIAGGANCSTRRPSVIELRSDAATAISDPRAGGTLTTSGQGFAISSLSGCGALDGLLSSVAAGSGNQATLHLTPASAQ